MTELPAARRRRPSGTDGIVHSSGPGRAPGRRDGGAAGPVPFFPRRQRGVEMESPGKAGDRYRAAVNPEVRALPAKFAGAAVPTPPRKWRLPVVPLLHNRHNIRGTTKEVLSNHEDK